MQHFPNLKLLNITASQTQDLLKLCLILDDVKYIDIENISKSTNVSNIMIDNNFIKPIDPIDKQVQAYTIQQLYHIEFQTDNISQNTFINQNIKDTLIKRIDQSILISLTDKERWIKLLRGDIEYQTILKIQKEFEQAEQKNNTDIIIKKVIVQSCKFLTTRYFNGQFYVGETRLPDMHGMHEDFIKFYMSSQVQDFFIQTQFGSKIRKGASNPVVQLTIDLIYRGINNNIIMD